MLGQQLVVSSYVMIKKGCPLAITIDNTNQVTVLCGPTPDDGFEFVLEREALRTFVELGTDALQEMDTPETT